MTKTDETIRVLERLRRRIDADIVRHESFFQFKANQGVSLATSATIDAFNVVKRYIRDEIRKLKGADRAKGK